MLAQREPEQKTRVTEVDCRSALSPSRLPGYDYSLNPYKGCTHGCKYCYVPNILNIPRKEWGHFVDVKRNIPKVLASELRSKKRGVVGLSTTTDPYQPLEEKFRLTRYCLEQLMRYDFPTSILTKSPLVTRDKDILTRFSEAEVGITITTKNESEIELLEPNAPSIESRIGAIGQLSEKGITTYAFLGPLYPTISEESLRELVEMIVDSGAEKIMADQLNLKPGLWSSLYNSMGEDRKIKRIWKEAVFGRKHHYHNLFDLLKKICLEQNIKFEMQLF